MQIIFTFSVNPETQEVVFAGNVEPQVALQMLQQIVIAEAVRKARSNNKPVEEVKQGQLVDSS